MRDGSDLVIEGFAFAPTFSIWTTIEECLNPPIVYERDRGWFTTAPFSEPELFTFPEGIGQLKCVNVEHEEVLLMPRWLDVDRVTFKYGLGDEFLEVLATLHRLGLDSTKPVSVRGVDVSPRDLVAAVLPNPAELGHRMTGRTCAGTLVTGVGHRRRTALHVPLPSRRQRVDDGRVRPSGRCLADRCPRRSRLGDAGDRRMEGRRGERTRGVLCRPVPVAPGRARRTVVDRGAVDRGAAIARLKKAQVERLLADYDADPIGALTVALRVALDRADATWTELLDAAPIDDERRRRLIAADERVLDQLAAELNERRGLVG